MRTDILEELRNLLYTYVREYFKKQVSFPQGNLKMITTTITNKQKISKELRQLKGLDHKKEWHFKCKWTKFSNQKTRVAK